jgi:hypothetical protein
VRSSRRRRRRPLAPARRRGARVCQRVDATRGGSLGRIARLEEGVAMSEAAVAADEHDARAHLALFCNLGKQIELSGLSWRIFARLRRARAEIDRAHELAPTDPDILAPRASCCAACRPRSAATRPRARAHPPRGRDRARPRRRPPVPGARDGRRPGARRRAGRPRGLAVAERSGAERERSEARALLASLE